MPSTAVIAARSRRYFRARRESSTPGAQTRAQTSCSEWRCLSTPKIRLVGGERQNKTTRAAVTPSAPVFSIAGHRDRTRKIPIDNNKRRFFHNQNGRGEAVIGQRVRGSEWIRRRQAEKRRSGQEF